jgi:hypothetical protein
MWFWSLCESRENSALALQCGRVMTVSDVEFLFRVIAIIDCWCTSATCHDFRLASLRTLAGQHTDLMRNLIFTGEGQQAEQPKRVTCLLA